MTWRLRAGRAELAPPSRVRRTPAGTIAISSSSRRKTGISGFITSIWMAACSPAALACAWRLLLWAEDGLRRELTGLQSRPADPAWRHRRLRARGGGQNRARGEARRL